MMINKIVHSVDWYYKRPIAFKQTNEKGVGSLIIYSPKYTHFLGLWSVFGIPKFKSSFATKKDKIILKNKAKKLNQETNKILDKNWIIFCINNIH